MKSKMMASVVGALAGMAAMTVHAATPAGLRVGAAKVDITPADMSLNSVGPFPWDGVHDPIYARALVMANGAETTAIVSLDLVDLPFDLKPLRDRIQREAGIGADHVMVMVTHDHSAPHFSRGLPACQVNGPKGGACAQTAASDAYTQLASDRIVQVLKQAKAGLKPARMGYAAGTADINVNRDAYGARGWGMGFGATGPSNKTVWVAKFETPDGKPIAVLFNYAVHSIATMDGHMVSGDIAGAAEHDVEQAYGGNVVALFTLGAAGDQNPRYPAFPPPPENRTKDRALVRQEAYAAMDAEGYMLGAEVLRVAGTITATVADPRIVADTSVLNCPVKPDKAAEGINGSVPINLSLLMIGDVAFAGVSGEVVTNIGTHLKKASPLSSTVLMTIANGRAGYLADDASYDLPIFEVRASPAARGCVESGIVDGLVGMIRKHN